MNKSVCTVACILIYLNGYAGYSQELTFALRVHENSNTVKYANRLLEKSKKCIYCPDGQKIHVEYIDSMLIVETKGLSVECRKVLFGEYVDLCFDFRNECRFVKLPNLFVSHRSSESFEVRIDRPTYKVTNWLLRPRLLLGRHTYTFWYRDPYFAVNAVGPQRSLPCK